MPSGTRELKEALKLAIKGLILQEVRILQLEQARSPSFVMDEISHSIQEAKREIIGLVRFMPAREKGVMIKRFILQSLDEEIDRTIRVRQKRCFRCIHVRYFDQSGASSSTLPCGGESARGIGCEMVAAPYGDECRSFVESPLSMSIGDYLGEMTCIYDVKEMFDQFERIWEEYLTK